MSAHILTVTKNACLFLKLPLPPVWGCILFANAWGSGSSKTGVSQPHVTGQESCQGEECKQWTELDSSEVEECSEWQCALQSLTNGMLDLLQTRERRRAGEPLCNAFHWWKVWEGGVGSERGGRPGGVGGGRERCFLRFHVLLQPPQFADKGCRCQGDLTEKGKVSGCVSPVLVQEA